MGFFITLKNGYKKKNKKSIAYWNMTNIIISTNNRDNCNTNNYLNYLDCLEKNDIAGGIEALIYWFIGFPILQVIIMPFVWINQIPFLIMFGFINP